MDLDFEKNVCHEEEEEEEEEEDMSPSQRTCCCSHLFTFLSHTVAKQRI
jgi:hypothetical protein